MAHRVGWPLGFGTMPALSPLPRLQPYNNKEWVSLDEHLVNRADTRGERYLNPKPRL